jgi:hypothetical protein
MNYKTYLFDGQMKKYWGGTLDDLNYIDNFVSLNELNPNVVEDWEAGDTIHHEIINDGRLQTWEIDTKIAKLVKQIFSQSTGNFIFIYKRGSHFPYEKNYPAEEANVPLFMLGNLPPNLDVNYKASHCNLFTTMLDLMNYPAEKRKRPLAISLLKATAANSQPRYYNPLLGEKFPFD